MEDFPEVVIAISNHLTSVVTDGRGKVGSSDENERKIDEAWMKCQEDIDAFVVHMWHTYGSAVRNGEDEGRLEESGQHKRALDYCVSCDNGAL